ncbi:diguanylate cyclase [Magnetovibrio sp.]|uniref:sensor domain-containing diguanylate cyclase n=1 Tax=Magnetovibrio sp. TaxID=2024836 RepID=UPI002F9361EF
MTGINVLFFSPVLTRTWLIVVCFLMPWFAFAQDAPRTLDAGWQYRWGDSPFDATGTPEWVLENAEQAAWRDIDFPSNPPGRDGQRNVWYRVTLPDGAWRDPVLYIYSVDLIAEVYLDGKRIYHYGTFDQDGQGQFEGWPWHQIDLPAEFSGKPIYFRVYSSYSDIGLWGEVMLMERLDLYQKIVVGSTEQIVIGGLSLLISLVALMFALVQSERRAYLLISLFTLASSIMLLSQSQMKQFVFNAPLVWDHFGATAYFSLPIIMALLFGTWCRGRHMKLITPIWIGHSGFVVFAIGGSVAGLLELSSLYLVFDALLTFSLIVLFTVAFSRFKSVANEVKAVIVTFAVFSLFLLVDMGVAHNVLPWTRMPIAWGLLVFSLAMIVISLRRFALTQQALVELNATLEQKVDDRTKELELLASVDPLTGMTNRRAFYEEAERIFQSSKRYGRNMSVLMLDIDHFKRINDTYGHAVGDQVLVEIASCFRQVCRETDLPARFGGEEFIVLLQEADQDAALKTAERLRQAITAINVVGSENTITASIGVSQLNEETNKLDGLILRADKAMYSAKAKGRNNCQVG